MSYFATITGSVTIPTPVPVTDNGGSLTVDGEVTAVGPLTDTELRATPVPISGTVAATGPLTDTQLRATPVPVSGTVAVSSIPTPIPVTDNSGSLTVDSPQLPAALGQSGGFISQLQDAHGHNAEINVMGDLLVSQPYRLAGANFTGTTLDTNFWATTLSTGTAVQTQGLVELASTAAASAYAHLASVSIARFVFAHPHRYRAVIGVPTVAVAHNTRRWGAYTVSTVTPQNGFYFELSSAGVLSVVTVSGGTPTAVASGSFNGHVSSYVVDTNLHAYEIHYFVMRVEFFVDGILLHTVTPGASPMTAGVYDLPIGATSINDVTGGVSGLLDVYNAIILRLGREMTHPKSFYQSGTVTAQILKRGPGLLQGLAISGVGNNANITLYDNITNSGTILFSTGAMATNTTPFNIDFGQGIPYTTGLTLNIATAAANATTRYE